MRQFKYTKYAITKDGKVWSYKTNRWLIPQYKNGYTKVRIDGKYILIHRMVALTFIPNPENKPCVNHINGIKSDNKVENLEWCTHSENSKHAYALGLTTFNENCKNKMRESNKKRFKELNKTKNMINELNPNAKAIQCIETLEIFKTLNQASKSINVGRSSIGNSIRRNHKCGGYTWKYIN